MTTLSYTEDKQRTVAVCLEPNCKWVWHSTSSVNVFKRQRSHTWEEGHTSFITMETPIHKTTTDKAQCECHKVAFERVMDSGIQGS